MKIKRIVVLATLLALAVVGGLLAFGFMSWPAAALYVIGIQVVAIAISERQPALFLSVLTAEQVKEFEEIMGELKQYADLLPKLKDSPRLLKDLDERITRLARVQLSSVGGGDVIRPGQLVSDKCAEHLVGLAIVAGQRKGKFDLLETSKRESLINMGRGFLGDGHFKTALSSSDIPLPVEYSGQVVQLVSQYGSARRYGTVFPGIGKLPKLKTDPAFTLLAQSTAITEKSPQTEWVTFAPEKFGGLIRLPSELDEDSIIPLGQFIADYAARNIALVEDFNFFVGAGTSTGANGAVAGLTYSTIANSKVVQMTSTKTHYSDVTLAYLRELRNVPDAAALRNAAYYMHPSFEQLLSTFNTSGNKPWNPQAQIQGNGANPFQMGRTLDGFEVRWVDVMPAYSTSANVSKVPILFGDLKFQYLAPRGPIRFQTSVDAAFETDEVLVRALERFTIGLMATGAVAGLETAAS